MDSPTLPRQLNSHILQFTVQLKSFTLSLQIWQVYSMGKTNTIIYNYNNNETVKKDYQDQQEQHFYVKNVKYWKSWRHTCNDHILQSYKFICSHVMSFFTVFPLVEGSDTKVLPSVLQLDKILEVSLDFSTFWYRIWRVCVKCSWILTFSPSEAFFRR